MPSVERETVDLVSPPQTANDQRLISDRNDMPREYDYLQSFKRKAHPPVPQPMDRPYEQSDKRRKSSLHEQEMYSRPGPNQAGMRLHMQEYLPMETRSRHRANPSQEIIDLTSSPRRPPHDMDGDRYATVQGYPVASARNHAHVPGVHRRSPVRIDYHGQPFGARPYAYMPENDRMYQRRPPPAHEYIPLRR